MYKQSELSLILLNARCFLASERFWTSVSASNGDSNDEVSASYLQLQPFMRVSQKPLKSKFLSICHWQVFKMILRADTFSFRLYWTFPYFFNAAFLKPSIYAEWWWKFKSFHQVQGSTHCKRWAKQYFYFNPNECDIQIYRRKNPLNELINLTLPIIFYSNG